MINFSLDIREMLRRRKIYEIADVIRKRLRKIGIEVEDTENGVRYRFRKEKRN